MSGVSRLQVADYAVVALYMLAMLAIGWWCGRKVRGSRGYFVGDGKLHFVTVGLSVLATYLSALTMIALPAMAYGEHDWTYTVQLPFLILTAYLITRFVVPLYRSAGVISVYELFEKRIHVSARLFGSVSFLVMSLARMSILLYLTSLAICTATGTDLAWTIVLMGVVTVLYTAVGGIKAVIYTDVIQAVVFVAGAFISLFFIVHDIPGAQFLAIAREHHKFRLLAPGLDPTKIVTVWLVLETIVQTLRIYGTQQDITQRYATTESTAKARRSVWVGTLAYIPLGYLFYFIGTALFVYYKVHPELPVPAKPDQIYPHFVVTAMPVGLPGLMIAAFLAASMSSIASSMNSVATVCVEDFMKRFARTPRPDDYFLSRAKLLTYGWGLLSVALALAFVKASYAQILWGKLMATCTNGVLGLLVLALLPIRIDKSGVSI
jgi:SSS family transporter